MTQKINIDQINLIISSSLELASQMSWSEVSFGNIAKLSKLKRSDIERYFSDKNEITAEIFKRVDDEFLENCDYDIHEENTKDRIFDVLMEKFEALNENRAAMLSIIKSISRDPVASMKSIPNLKKSMALVLNTAGVESSNPISEKTRVVGLSGIYLAGLKVWMIDDTSDLSRTMAELDKRLSQAQELVNSFSFLKKASI